MICKTCKIDKDQIEFLQVIKRRDYGITCDADGYTYFCRDVIRCAECRMKNLKSVRKGRKSKAIV